MSYTCSTIQQAEQPTLVVRTRAAIERLPEALGAAWGAIMAYAGPRSAPSGPPFVAYHNADMQDLDLEIGLPFANPLEGEGEVEAGTIPASLAVETIHVGPYDDIGAAYEALRAWMKENGRVPAGPAYEHYVDDPDDVAPDELRTRIVWPIR